MATRVEGTFTIENWAESELLEHEGGSKVTRAQVARSFEGGLEGVGAVEWLMAYGEDGTATFVRLERIVGKVEGKTGAFVLQRVGTFDGQVAKAGLLVVPGTGTGDLVGLRGEGTFEAGLGPEGERSITLDLESL